MRSEYRKIVYALLSLIGLVVTWTFNLRFMAANGGLALTDFVAATHVNAAASSISYDLLVVVATFLFWSFLEAKRLRMRHWWVYLVLTFAIAAAFALPLFMYMRERALATRSTGETC